MEFFAAGIIGACIAMLITLPAERKAKRDREKAYLEMKKIQDRNRCEEFRESQEGILKRTDGMKNPYTIDPRKHMPEPEEFRVRKNIKEEVERELRRVE